MTSNDATKFKKQILAYIDALLALGGDIARAERDIGLEEEMRPRLLTGDPDSESSIQALTRSTARLGLLGARRAQLEQRREEQKAQLCATAITAGSQKYAAFEADRQTLVSNKVAQVEALLEGLPAGAVRNFLWQYESLIGGYAAVTDRMNAVNAVLYALRGQDCSDPVGLIRESLLPLL